MRLLIECTLPRRCALTLRRGNQAVLSHPTQNKTSGNGGNTPEEARNRSVKRSSRHGETPRQIRRKRKAPWSVSAPHGDLWLLETKVLTGIRTLARFIDAQRPTIEVFAVQGGDRVVGGGIIHLDEGKTTRSAGLAIGNHLYGVHGAIRTEQITLFVFIAIERQVAYINGLHNQKSLSRKTVPWSCRGRRQTSKPNTNPRRRRYAFALPQCWGSLKM